MMHGLIMMIIFDVIQNIEDMVNRIKYKLEDIKGIDIIDEANELLEELGDYIY